MDLWKARNELVHGGGSISLLDRQRTAVIVRALYDELLPDVLYCRNEIFPGGEQSIIDKPYRTQVAWLDSIRYLFPEQYRVISYNAVEKLQADTEIEALRLRDSGQVAREY